MMDEHKQLLTDIIERNVNQQTYNWIQEKASGASGNRYQLNLAFTAMPRKTGKKEVVLETSDLRSLEVFLPAVSVQKWTIDQVTRVWLLMQLEASDKNNYIASIENLFLQAEMNELVALYSSLPVLAYPEAWKWRCSEGIRSNIGTVLEAIMYHNPYPVDYLEEGPWNQMIMKAFFTDKNVNHIIGLDQRSNQNLAFTLFDYVEERWAAGRRVNPQIWRLTGKYIDEAHLYMMEKLFTQGDETERQAAVLACMDSSFEKCTELLEQHPESRTAVKRNELSWESIVVKQ